jgi:hypothetical protein
VITPNTWVEEERSEIVETIVDDMISTLTLEEMRRIVWDNLYDDLIHQDWSDIWMAAEQYSPELLEEFQSPVSKESSH